MEKWSTEWKEHKLQELYAQWEACDRCPLHETRHRVVFGEGDPDADIFLISEAPGEREDQSGSPFQGVAGEVLDLLFHTLGINRYDWFITNVVGCRPPENRDPTRVEKDLCAERVQQLIYIVDPLLIVTAGKVALQAMVKGRAWSVEKEHGQLFTAPHPSVRVTGEPQCVTIPGKVLPLKKRRTVYHLEYDLVPIFHPAYISRFDSYDEKKGRFRPGGLAHQTLDDLRGILSRVQNMKSDHETTSRSLNRSQ